MAFNLLEVFEKADLKKFGRTTANIISLAFTVNKKTGARIARAVLDDGITLVKTVTSNGAVIEEAISLPVINNAKQRNALIQDLYSNKRTQEQIAAMLNISQATVSNVIRKNK